MNRLIAADLHALGRVGFWCGYEFSLYEYVFHQGDLDSFLCAQSYYDCAGWPGCRNLSLFCLAGVRELGNVPRAVLAQARSAQAPTASGTTGLLMSHVFRDYVMILSKL